MLTEQSDGIAAKLDALIAATKAASLPFNVRWLDAESVGLMLGFQARHVLENLACRPDFPKPLRVNGTGHPRWKASEILAWADLNRATPKVYAANDDRGELQRKAGRRRRQVA